jgi:hypothetical protein
VNRELLIGYNNFKYLKATFSNAKKICDSRQMDLLSVDSKKEERNLESFLSSQCKRFYVKKSELVF